MPGGPALLLRILDGLFSPLIYVFRDDSSPSALETGQQSVNGQVFIKHPRVHCPLEAWSDCSFCTFLWAILFLTWLSSGRFCILNANVYGLRAYLTVPRVGWLGDHHCLLVTHTLSGASQRPEKLLEEAYGNIRGRKQSRQHFLRIVLKSWLEIEINMNQPLFFPLIKSPIQFPNYLGWF